MSAGDGGGPAFPQTYRPDGHTSWADGYGGMSLRDYFAAQALGHALSASADRDGAYDYVAAAVGAYLVADAMLAERSSR